MDNGLMIEVEPGRFEEMVAAGVLPDRITIYRQAICAICRSEQEVADRVRRTRRSYVTDMGG
jgi:predicted Zn-dependent protease with MMP-like domain